MISSEMAEIQKVSDRVIDYAEGSDDRRDVC